MRMYRAARSSPLQKRATFPVTVGNAILDNLYYVNASVGTPPQLVQLQIDTGSSDVWMFGPHSCDTTTSPCLGGECESQHVFCAPETAGGEISSIWLHCLCFWCGSVVKTQLAAQQSGGGLLRGSAAH